MGLRNDDFLHQYTQKKLKTLPQQNVSLLLTKCFVYIHAEKTCNLSMKKTLDSLKTDIGRYRCLKFIVSLL